MSVDFHSDEFDDVVDENDAVLSDESVDDETLDDVGVGAGASALSFLIERARRHPLLSAEEEQALSEAIKAGSQVALEKMVLSNILLVIKISKRYAFTPDERMEMIQDGFLGLHRAAEKFDGERGFRFSTYATWWIRQNIQRRSYNYRRVVSVPTHFEKRLRVAQRIEAQLAEQGGKLTVDELMAETSMTRAQAQDVMAFMDVKISLNAGGGEDGDMNLEERVTSNLPSTESEAEDACVVQNLKDMMLGALSERQFTVLDLRFGLTSGTGETLDVIGEKLGVTRERVRQIESVALKKLSRNLAMEGYHKQDLLSAMESASDVTLDLHVGSGM